MMTPSPKGKDLINFVARVSEDGPKLRYLASANPELPMTILVDEVGRDGRPDTLCCPVLVYGHQCEALAEGLEGADTAYEHP
jgi:hypothetical protein